MDDFLDHNNQFDRLFRHRLAHRYPTMRAALNLLYQLPNHNIVETGCMRVGDSLMEGNSTKVFGYFAYFWGGSITTIDVNKDNLGRCREATKQYKDLITYVWDDSVIYLQQTRSHMIDLLYLDSMDCPVSGDASEAQKHQLNELLAGSSLLHAGSLVLLDDNAFENGGKTLLSKKWLREEGWLCILDMYQSLWMKAFY